MSEKSLSSYEIQSKSKKSSFGLNFKPKKLLKSVTKGLGGKSVSLSDISYLNRNKKSDSLPNIENITNETTGKYSKFRYSEKATKFEKVSHFVLTYTKYMVSNFK